MDLRNSGQIKKIAVLRANALGDFIFILPALQALRETFKDSEIVYLGQQWHKDFLTGRPGPIDRVIEIPKYNGIPHEIDKIQDEKKVKTFFEAMQKEEFDIAFQMHGGGRNSNPFIKQLRAKLTIGLKTSDAPPLDINLPYYLYHNEVLRYLEVVALSGARTKNIQPELTVTESDKKQLESFVELNYPYAVIHPGASDVRRRWPAEKFALVGDELAEKGIKVYLTGIETERAVTEKVWSLMRFKAENLCSKLSMKALTALLSEACIVISNDTGPLQLARALKVPKVGIVWCGNMITAGAMSALKNRNCIGWIGNCPLCGADCTRGDAHKATNFCNHETSFVDDVPVYEVVENALELLATFSKKRKTESILRI